MLQATAGVEGLIMTDVSCLSSADCRRAAQYLLTMLAVLLVGFLLSLLPVMARLEFAGAIPAAEIVVFTARLAALSLFFLCARHIKAAMPERGGAWTFVRGIVEPVTVLVIVIIGQGLLWQMLEYFVRGTGRTVYFVTVITLIFAAGIWLVFRAYQQAPYLVEAIQAWIVFFSRSRPERGQLCLACGEKLPKEAKFCSHCGYELDSTVKCRGCGDLLLPGQKYCQHCGMAVVAVVPTDSER